MADTLAAGGSLCDRAVVERVVGEAPRRIAELIALGTKFDEVDGKLALGREGGHGRDRIAHALGDATGKEITRAVAAPDWRMRRTSRCGTTRSPSIC